MDINNSNNNNVYLVYKIFKAFIVLPEKGKVELDKMIG